MSKRKILVISCANVPTFLVKLVRKGLKLFRVVSKLNIFMFIIGTLLSRILFYEL